MKIIYLIPLLILFSCRTPQQLIDKAIKKQPDIFGKYKDTFRIPTIHYDTVWTETGFEVIKEIHYTDTIIELRYIAPKSKYDYKSERDALRHALALERLNARKYKDSLTEARKIAKFTEKTARVESRTDRVKSRTERSRWWVWLITGIFIGLILTFLLRIAKKFMNIPTSNR